MKTAWQMQNRPVSTRKFSGVEEIYEMDMYEIHSDSNAGTKSKAIPKRSTALFMKLSDEDCTEAAIKLQSWWHMKLSDKDCTEAAIKLQSWWRMKHAQKIYRNRIKPDAITSFIGGIVASLLIRIAVLAYVITILCTVITSMDETAENSRSSSPANAEHIEQSVLYKLMVSNANLAGYANIVACRCVLLTGMHAT